MNKYSVTLYLSNAGVVNYIEENYDKETVTKVVMGALSYEKFIYVNGFQIVNTSKVEKATIKLIEEKK